MRVLLLTADYPPTSWSGIGVVVDRQARALAGAGVEVHVLVGRQERIAAPPPTPNGPFIYPLSADHCPFDPWAFDRVHLHSLALSELAFELCRRTHVPLIYTAHSLLHIELENTPTARFWQAVQECVLVASDHVVFLSAAEQHAALQEWPDLALRSSVIPNSVPPPPDPIHPPVQEGPIVFAGRFTKNKGVDLLAELIPWILARRTCQFVLAGGHGDQVGERIVRDVLARFPTACRLVGWLERADLDCLFAQSCLVLVPSRYEPLGLVALEAMRVGAPVLAAAVGGLVEVVRADSGGRLVASLDPEHWGAAVLEILANPELAGELRQRGPGYVAERFSTMRMVERLLDEVYQTNHPVPA